MKKIFIGLSLLAMLLATSGCVSGNKDTLTSFDVERLTSQPKVQSFGTPDTFEFVFKSGVVRQFALGKITKLRAPKTSCFDGSDCFEWVPVDMELVDSYPRILNRNITIRLFPNAEQTPDLHSVQSGDLVLAATTEKFSDDNNLVGYSLGWLFTVNSESEISSLDPNSSVKGTLHDVNLALGTNFRISD